MKKSLGGFILTRNIAQGGWRKEHRSEGRTAMFLKPLALSVRDGSTTLPKLRSVPMRDESGVPRWSAQLAKVSQAVSTNTAFRETSHWGYELSKSQSARRFSALST
jgi:hypothetical protein